MRRLPFSLVITLTALLYCVASHAESTGKILFEVWNDVVGPNVADLKTSSYPNNPNESTYLSAFEAPIDGGETFGARIRGFVHAPKSGEYTFWISSDDQGELWLSTDEDPAKKQMICTCPEWSKPEEYEKYPVQKSKPVKLIAGKKYYIEAVYKENYRGDHCQVGWQIPGGPLERPIPGNRLSPAAKAKTDAVKPPASATKCVISGELPTKPGFYKQKCTVSKGQVSVELPFALFIPNNYTATGEKFPMLTFLHGNNESGTDLEGVYVFGPLIAMKIDKGLRDSMQGIIIAPQVPLWKNWDEGIFHKSVNALVQELTNKLNIDPDRVSITGMEMGGKGCWRASMDAPSLYAAIVPMACEAVRPNEAPEILKRSEIVIHVGAEDGGYTEQCKQMAKAFELRKRPVKLELNESSGHAVWLKPYADRGFYQWVFAQKLKPEAQVAVAAPVVPAENKTEVKAEPAKTVAATNPAAVPATAISTVASDAQPRNNTMLFVLAGVVLLGVGFIVFGIMRGRSGADDEDEEEDDNGIPMPGRVASVRRAKIAKT